MAFCTKCGVEIADGIKFCPECGTATNYKKEDTQRKQEYSGKIIKCPNCGEVLKSFVSMCPSCGYEIRGLRPSEPVQEFAIKLSQATSEEQKITLLRSFPIPNTKEDIFEFMILAASNINANQQLVNDNLRENISEAWLAKFEQSYQKALLLFNSDSDLSKIKKIYDESYKKTTLAKKRATTKKMLETVVKNIVVCMGIVAVVAAVIVDNTGGNTAMLELVGYIVLIASACTLVKRNASMIDFGIGALSGLATIGLSFLLDNGSMGEICGGIVLIIIAINFFKSVGSDKNKY